MNPALLDILCCPRCQGALTLGRVQRASSDRHIHEGLLHCAACGQQFPIERGVPDLSAVGSSSSLDRAAGVYGYLWKRTQGRRDTPRRSNGPVHFITVQEAVPPLAISGPWALDLGCGNGKDCAYLADAHPTIHWVGVDIHSSLRGLAELSRGRPNLHVVRGSANRLPFRSQSFGFAYSYGVLHHLERPQQGFSELVRVLLDGASFAFYVYEAHEETWWKRVPLGAVSWCRRLTTRLPAPILFGLCWLASPFVVLGFSAPARVAACFPATRSWKTTIPFHFARGPFSVAGDLYDRFGSPIEHRFTRQQLLAWYQQLPVSGQLTHPLDVAGWIGWGGVHRKRASNVQHFSVS